MVNSILPWLALVIAILTGLFTIYQVRYNNITNSRIKWLDNFKQLISNFFSECLSLTMKMAFLQKNYGELYLQPTGEKMKFDKKENYGSIVEHIKLIENTNHLIKLSLDPTEAVHLKFEGLLDSYVYCLKSLPRKMKNHEEFMELLKKMSRQSDTLVELTRYITQLEWEKINRSYLSRQYYMHAGKGKKIYEKAMNLEAKPANKI